MRQLLFLGTVSVLVAAWAPLLPAAHQGVPRLDPDYSVDVNVWWGRHPFNARFPGYDPAIISPSPTINVADVHAANPASLTGGIEEALALLPSEGGTLWLPASHGVYLVTKVVSRYDNRYRGYGRIQLLRRSNIHFLSDGATIRGGGMIRISSQEFADHGTENNPVRNFYFSHLNLDCDNDSCAITCEGVRDVVFDHCNFLNIGMNTVTYEHGACYCISKSDNWWFRDCSFAAAAGGGRWGFHPDGARGTGLLNCAFTGAFQAGVMIFTNDDVDRRWPGYLVFANNHFSGSYADAAIGMSAAQVYLTGNNVDGAMNYFCRMDGKLSAFNYTYYYYYNKIAGNTFGSGVGTILYVQSAYYPVPNITPYRIGKYTVRGNRCAAATTLVTEQIRDPQFTIDEPKIVQNNGPGIDVTQYQATPADLNNDLAVSPADLEIMAEQWLLTGSSAADIDRNAAVNLRDFSYMDRDWSDSGDRVNPTTPANLRVANLTHVSLSLAWDAASDNAGVAGYRIYRDGLQVGATQTTAFADAGLAPQTAYTYTVRAYDYNDNVSPESLPLPVTTMAPPAITNLFEDSDNPGFEQESPAGEANRWQDRGPDMLRDATQAKTGSASLKIAGANTSSPYSFNWGLKGAILNGKLQQGVRYRLGAWVKGQGVTGNGGGVRLYLPHSGGTIEWQNSPQVKPAEWTSTNIDFTAANVATLTTDTRIDVYWSLTAGVLWFDDITLAPLP